VAAARANAWQERALRIVAIIESLK
jgi:hypothetical protein